MKIHKGGKTIKQTKNTKIHKTINRHVNNTIYGNRNRNRNIQQSEREILEYYGKFKNKHFNINDYQRMITEPSNEERLQGELATENEIAKNELEWIKEQHHEYEKKQNRKREKKRKKREKRKQIMKTLKKTLKNVMTMKPLRKRIKKMTRKIKNKK